MDVPGYSGLGRLPEVDGQHEEQVVGQDLRPHPDVVIETCNNTRVIHQQCDQTWRNFATLAKF